MCLKALRPLDNEECDAIYKVVVKVNGRYYSPFIGVPIPQKRDIVAHWYDSNYYLSKRVRNRIGNTMPAPWIDPMITGFINLSDAIYMLRDFQEYNEECLKNVNPDTKYTIITLTARDQIYLGFGYFNGWRYEGVCMKKARFHRELAEKEIDKWEEGMYYA